MMHGLRTWWVDAVGTTALKLHISPMSLLFGAMGGVIAALLCIVWTLRQLRRQSTRGLLSGVVSGEVGKRSWPPHNGAADCECPCCCGCAFPGSYSTKTFRAGGRFLRRRDNTICRFPLLSISIAVQPYKPHQWSGRLASLTFGLWQCTYRAGRSVLCIALMRLLLSYRFGSMHSGGRKQV